MAKAKVVQQAKDQFNDLQLQFSNGSEFTCDIFRMGKFIFISLVLSAEFVINAKVMIRTFTRPLMRWHVTKQLRNLQLSVSDAEKIQVMIYHH